MKAIVAGFLLGLAATSAAAAADPLLSGLVGEWTGRGTMKLTADGASERVYCKITNTLASDGSTLTQNGRCTLASSAGRIDGSITAKGGGRYSGTLASLISKGPATLTGRGTSKRLDLDAAFVDRLSGEPAKATNTIELLPGGGYRLSATRVNPKDGKSYDSSEIVFSAK